MRFLNPAAVTDRRGEVHIQKLAAEEAEDLASRAVREMGEEMLAAGKIT